MSQILDDVLRMMSAVPREPLLHFRVAPDVARRLRSAGEEVHAPLATVERVTLFGLRMVEDPFLPDGFILQAPVDSRVTDPRHFQLFQLAEEGA